MRSVRRALRKLESSDLHSKGEPPINLVPMIDVMVVLTLYLLITTLVKHIAVIELNMPTTAPVEQVEQPKFQLSVTVRDNELVVGDRYGAIQRLPNNEAGYDIESLTALLIDIKRKAPDETAINLLFEPDITYDVIVAVMDAARLWPEGLPPEFGENLFPDVALGDAPKLEPAP